MRKAFIFLALMLIGAASASTAQANVQCEALSDAVSKGDSDLTAALVASGVSVNCSYAGSYVEKDSGKTVTYTTTPLNQAAWGGTSKSVQLLLSHGANVNLKDGQKKTPLWNADGYLFYLEVLGDASKEDWEEAKKIYRLLEQAGGVQ